MKVLLLLSGRQSCCHDVHGQLDGPAAKGCAAWLDQWLEALRHDRPPAGCQAAAPPAAAPKPDLPSFSAAKEDSAPPAKAAGGNWWDGIVDVDSLTKVRWHPELCWHATEVQCKNSTV